MACAAQWPAPACGWNGECRNGSCVCGDGYQVNPIVVDGITLCTVIPAAVDAMLALWLVGVLVSVPVTALSIWLKARAERSVSRPAGRVEYLKNAVFALSSVILTSGTALSLSGDGWWLFQNRAVTAVLCFAVVLCDLGLVLETVRYMLFANDRAANDFKGRAMPFVNRVSPRAVVALTSPRFMLAICIGITSADEFPMDSVLRATFVVEVLLAVFFWRLTNSWMAPVKAAYETVVELLDESTEPSMRATVIANYSQIQRLAMEGPAYLIARLLIALPNLILPFWLSCNIYIVPALSGVSLLLHTAAQLSSICKIRGVVDEAMASKLVMNAASQARTVPTTSTAQTVRPATTASAVQPVTTASSATRSAPSSASTNPGSAAAQQA